MTYDNLVDVPDAIRDFYEVTANDVVTLKQRPETKTIQDLERVALLNKPTSVLTKFAELVISTNEWKFFDKYTEYLNEVEEITSFNEDKPLDVIQDDVVVETIQPKELPSEPTFTPLVLDNLLNPYLRQKFKSEREILVNSLTYNYETDDDIWVFDADRDSIIYMAARITSMGDNTTNLWVLNDNRIVHPTKEQFIEIHDGMINKINEVWVQP